MTIEKDKKLIPVMLPIEDVREFARYDYSTPGAYPRLREACVKAMPKPPARALVEALKRHENTKTQYKIGWMDCGDLARWIEYSVDREP